MLDPHVKALHYRVVCCDTVNYDKASPLPEHETDAFKVRVANGKAIFEMKQHYASVETARKTVEDFIRSWEVYASLQYSDLLYGPDGFRLEFEEPEIIDRAEPSAICFYMPCVSADICALAPKICLSASSYPEPPSQFSVSPDVEVMCLRYKMYRDGRESLASMANFCLTVIETPFREKKIKGEQKKKQGKAREKAADHYFVNPEILSDLGDLLANKGGPDEARKAPSGGSYDPFTLREKEWMESVVRILIRRVVEYEANPKAALPKITMTELPERAP